MEPVNHGGPDRAGVGLEGQLRNLILTNAVGSDTGHSQGGETSQDAASTTKGNKKRPNQAQRRQMVSQFSIPVDTRQQQPPPSIRAPFHQPRNAHQPPPPGHQHQTRHMNGPHPHHVPMHEGGSYQQPHSSWNGPHRAQPQGSPILPTQPHNQRRPGAPDQRGLYNWRGGPSATHQPSRPQFTPEQIAQQTELLDQQCYQVVSNSEIARQEIMGKEEFRQRIELIIREVITNHEQEQAQRWDFPSPSVELKCFGSLASGFATRASDMDLGLFSPLSKLAPDAPGSPIPRLVEKALLDAGLGARLLTRTRVPIIKLCERPTDGLFTDLQAERRKYEDESTNDNRTEQPEDREQDHDATLENHEKNDVGLAEPVHEPTATTAYDFVIGEGASARRFYLKQGTQGLSAYEGQAKRVLRLAGGRDMKTNSLTELNDMEWTILDRVCEAYVQGLADATLRQQLQQFPSLSFAPTEGRVYHLLRTVCIQVEGEHILQRWRSLLQEEGVQTVPPEADRTIGAWECVQARPNFGANPTGYVRDLTAALDRVKKLPSVHLLLLEQIQPETPLQYHASTNKVLAQLRSQQFTTRTDLEVLVANHYIAGIYPAEIRAAVQSAIADSPEPLKLAAVGRRHKSLQLAREMEKAIEQKMYGNSGAQIEDVKLYIEILRSPLRKTQKGHASFDFVVPITKATSELAARARGFPDPRLFATNQPKDKYHDKLDFAKLDVGVQCDINFAAHLAIHNTALLRCYSHTDPRVKPMILFVKHWAKVRGINSGYRGTLSSYGYVLMVLHYLINVAQPFVCPNLQQLAPPPPPHLSPAEVEQALSCMGYKVDFWRNEEEIRHLAANNQLNGSKDSLGQLLRGFFEYYAHTGIMSNDSGKAFDWGRDVLSIRTPGGLVSKQAKGWTGAKTVYQGASGGGGGEPVPEAPPTQAAVDEANPPSKPGGKSDNVKEVRLRYLCAIEDPFETDHNVARTVTHNGIVSIRDEFRRAWRVIKAGRTGHEDLLSNVNEEKVDQASYVALLHDIHGPVIFDD